MIPLLGRRGFKSYVRDLLAEMDTLFGTLPDYEVLFTQLSTAQQKDKETVRDFASRVAGLESRIRMAFPDELFPERQSQNRSLTQIALDRAYKGLRKPIRDALRPQVRGGQLRSFQSLVLMAREVEADDKPAQKRAETAEAQKVPAPESQSKPIPRSVFPNPLKRYFKAKGGVKSRHDGQTGRGFGTRGGSGGGRWMRRTLRASKRRLANLSCMLYSSLHKRKRPLENPTRRSVLTAKEWVTWLGNALVQKT